MTVRSTWLRSSFDGKTAAANKGIGVNVGRLSTSTAKENELANIKARTPLALLLACLLGSFFLFLTVASLSSNRRSLE